ncbi:hypothetical protein [Hymenobacter rubripertinctus]|uniref:Uncharacterized protein n=1 Tax=Hymenobacter rubripertinctus TaxID=2029981 RepID=A0A418QXY9_9BACT|nr:hypothetical protein [Hymenobacter rubripertinctus]RIY10037.1 hypothetical protein D0T11_10875 [Hymenobacter rubripertinctus]
MEFTPAPLYFLDAAFGQRAHQWPALLERVLLSVNYLALNQLLRQGPLSDIFRQAQVALPQQVARVYGATHRFRLTPAIQAYCRAMQYLDWPANDFEDPAFYCNGQLVLGTISHEDYVVLWLSEAEKEALNQQGYDFWCRWQQG